MNTNDKNILNIEKFNRLISFISTKICCDCIYVEKTNFENINYYLLHVVTKTDKQLFIELINDFNDMTESFEKTYFENDVFYLLSGNDLMIKLFYDYNLEDKLMVNLDYKEKYDIVYLDSNLEKNESIINEAYENKIVLTINKMLLNLNEYVLFYKAKDYVLSFNSLNKVNDDIIRFLSLHYMKEDFCKLTNVYSKMTKKEFKDFETYQKMLKFDRINETGKLMIWFISEYVKNLPISIISKINIDYFFRLKKEILGF